MAREVFASSVNLANVSLSVKLHIFFNKTQTFHSLKSTVKIPPSLVSPSRYIYLYFFIVC